jgi:cytochrome c peroxidase
VAIQNPLLRSGLALSGANLNKGAAEDGILTALEASNLNLWGTKLATRLSTGDTVQTTDPGRAMITGKWADIGKFKGPILRALAARAPYFHNGSAATLEEAVGFYETRFNIQLTARKKADLVAFLRAL